MGAGNVLSLISLLASGYAISKSNDEAEAPDLTDLEARVAALEATVGTPGEGATATIIEVVEALTTDVGALAQDVATLQGTFNSLPALEAQIAAIDTRLSYLEGGVQAEVYASTGIYGPDMNPLGVVETDMAAGGPLVGTKELIGIRLTSETWGMGDATAIQTNCELWNYTDGDPTHKTTKIAEFVIQKVAGIAVAITLTDGFQATHPVLGTYYTFGTPYVMPEGSSLHLTTTTVSSTNSAGTVWAIEGISTPDI